MDVIYSRRQYHQWYTLIKFNIIFTSKLSTNYNNIQQASVSQTKFQSIIKYQQNIYSSLCIPPLPHELSIMRSLLFLLRPPPLLPHLQNLCQKMTLELYFTPLLFNWKPWFSWDSNNLRNQICLDMKWPLSKWKHSACQSITRISKKVLPSFHKK